MANNKFTVFGVLNNTIYSTDSTDTTRTNLFLKGMEPYTTARAEDVNTGLKETSLVTVSILEWIKEFTEIDFASPEPDTEENNLINTNAFINNVHTGLENKISKRLEVKENTIPKGAGFLKYHDNSWIWDNSVYQLNSKTLDSITSIGSSSSSGIVRKTAANTFKIDTTEYIALDSFSDGVLRLKTITS